MIRRLRCILAMTLSLFGGLSFADAPIQTVNLSNAAASGATTPAAVVDANALLASLTPEQRIERLENQVQYLSSYNTQLQSLSTQVDLLRGQVETLNHEVALLQNPPPTLSSATPLASPSSSTPPSTSSSASTKPVTTPAALTPPPTPEQQAFTKAYTELIQKQYANATTDFNTFLKQYPNSTQAPDAHYWLGELYLAQGYPDRAADQYRTVVNVPNATHRPDAMLKWGTILLAYGDNTRANTLLKQLISQYPNTPQAKEAQQKLTQASS